MKGAWLAWTFLRRALYTVLPAIYLRSVRQCDTKGRTCNNNYCYLIWIWWSWAWREGRRQGRERERELPSKQVWFPVNFGATFIGEHFVLEQQIHMLFTPGGSVSSCLCLVALSSNLGRGSLGSPVKYCGIISDQLMDNLRTFTISLPRLNCLHVLSHHYWTFV